MAEPLSDGGGNGGRMIEGRSATWLELFFDLIFVINIAGLTHHLAAHPDADTLGQVAALYLPLFLVWAGHTTYATRFDDGSILQTMLTLLLMFALAGSAVFVQSGMDEQAASFTRAQFAARAVLALLYLEAHFRVPAARRFTWFLLVGFAVSAVAWGAQEWLAVEWRRPLYLAAIGAEILAPLLAVSRLGHWPANPHHLPERLGLFTIIVLGEAVRGVVVGAVHAEAARLGFMIGFALPVGIWWFYFRLLDRGELRRRVGGGQILAYLHLPMTLAVVVMAAAVEAILTTFGSVGRSGAEAPGLLEAARRIVVPDGAIAPPVDAGSGLTGARLLFGGLAVWLTCFLAMRVYVVSIRRLGAAEWITAGAGAALAAGAVLIGPVRALEVFIFCGSLLLALAALGSLLKDLRRRRAARPPRPAATAERLR